MNHPPHEPFDPHDELPGEAELRALYHTLPAAEPSAALDHAVRRLASAAVPTTTRRRARRPAALATAAVLILAVGLGWQMREKPSAGDMHGAQRYVLPTDAVVQPAPVPPLQASPAPPTATTEAAPDIRHAPREATAPSMASFDARTAPKPFLSTRRPTATLSDKPAVSTRAIAHGLTSGMLTAPAPPAPPAPPSPPALVESTMPSAIDTPEQQLDEIRRLFAQGRASEARRRLGAFHRDHPGWKLPPELRAELHQP